MLLCYSQAYQNTKKPKNWTKNSKTHAKMTKTIKLSWKKYYTFWPQWYPTKLPLLVHLWWLDIIEVRRYVTAMELGLIPKEFGTISSVLTRSFKVRKCGGYKLESKHHSGARYLSLPKLMGNSSCHPQLCTNTRITRKIFTSTSHWTGQSIKHHLVIWIEMSGLNPWPNSPIYAFPPLSTIIYSSLMGSTVTLKTLYWYKQSANTCNRFNWRDATQSTTRPTIISLSITRWRLYGCWSMGRKGFHLTTWTLSWWKHGMNSRCLSETSSDTYLWKQTYSPQPSWLYNKYTCMWCLYLRIFRSQGWKINNISRHIVGPIEVQVTKTDDTMVGIREKGAQQSPRNIILWAGVYNYVRRQIVPPIQ